jgi:hypothetical protein
MRRSLNELSSTTRRSFHWSRFSEEVDGAATSHCWESGRSEGTKSERIGGLGSPNRKGSASHDAAPSCADASRVHVDLRRRSDDPPLRFGVSRESLLSIVEQSISAKQIQMVNVGAAPLIASFRWKEPARA